jgi:uncharacterized repeat protein (TIGR03803 family)
MSRHDRSCSLSRAAAAALAIATMFALTALITSSAQAQTYEVLWTFTGGGDGAFPYAGLTWDRAGNLYGTTQYRGGNGCYLGEGCGTVFRLKHAGSGLTMSESYPDYPDLRDRNRSFDGPAAYGWVLNPLYNFQGDTDGGNPMARVIFGPDGSLYGTTQNGGNPACSFGCGTVFNLKPPPTACKTALCPWTETVLYRFSGSDGANPQNGALLIAPSGIIYGTTLTGGAYKHGVVFSLTPSQGAWTYSVIYSFTGGTDGAGPYSGVISDNAGNLYGTTCGGGYSYSGAVYELLPSGSGWNEKVLYSFTGSQQDGYAVCPVGGLIFDGSGNLYGTTGTNPYYITGGDVFELTPSNGSWTIAHVVVINGGPDGAGPVDSLVMDAAGNLYGTMVSTGNPPTGAIFEVSTDWTMTYLYRWSQGGAEAYGSPIFDANGNLYGTNFFAGQNNDGVVWKITP